MNKNWKPRPYDIWWTQNLIETLRDGAVWGIPRASSVWRLDKTNKVFTLIHGDPQAPDNHALRVILPMIGYTAAEKLEPMTPQQISEAMAGTGKTIERPILPNN